MPRNQGGVPIPYLLAGASTVIVVVILLLTMSGGSREIPADEPGAIKAAVAFMKKSTSIYDTPNRDLRVEDPPSATRTSKGYTVRGRVGFRPSKGAPPANHTSWEAYVEFDTKRRAWAVADWKQR